MSVPKPLGEIIGAIVITAIIVSFVIMALLNLLAGDALIASSIWLLLVSAAIVAMCIDEGTREFSITVLGTFARKQFVETSGSETQPLEIRFGYQLLGHRFYYLKIDINRIESVDWRPGQATDRMGRDMNDWSVCMWYDIDDPSKRRACSVKPDQEIYIVGPSGRKEDTETFGRSFVAFLRAAGVSLIETEDRGEPVFRRPQPQSPTNPNGVS